MEIMYIFESSTNSALFFTIGVKLDLIESWSATAEKHFKCIMTFTHRPALWLLGVGARVNIYATPPVCQIRHMKGVLLGMFLLLLCPR